MLNAKMQKLKGSRLRGQTGRWVLAVVLNQAAWSAEAEPYTPSDDDEVLETLPAQLIGDRGEFNALRDWLRDDPDNAELAATLAGRYVRVGKQSNDLRYFGYARSAIGPWWEADDAPTPILMLRADLKEADHQYDEAVADLRRVVERSASDRRAWLRLAYLYRMQGRYDAAREAADRVGGPGDAMALFGRVPLMAVTGEAQSGYDALREAQGQLAAEYPGAAGDVLRMLTELALVVGREDLAAEHFDQALAEGVEDPRLLRLWADHLLDIEAYAQALEVVEPMLNDNACLLLAAIAAERDGQTGKSLRYAKQLKQRFDAIKLRRGTPHARIESRYVLTFEDDAQRALELALDNWQRLKEPEDSRAVLEAALAARKPASAQPVIDFLTRYGTEHLELQRLIARLGAL